MQTSTGMSRRAFVAGSALAALAAGSVSTALADEVVEGAAEIAGADEGAASDVPEIPATRYEAYVYDFDGLRIHGFNIGGNGEAIVCYIVEADDALIGVERPSTYQGNEDFVAYAESLGKPMGDQFVSAHPNGAEYTEGMSIYGTQAAADAIAGGSTKETADSVGSRAPDTWDFNYCQVNTVIEAGSVTVGGVDFEIVEYGDVYDLALPAAHAVFTHMLGGNVHSIVAGIDGADAMIAQCQKYLDDGYTLILSTHAKPEGQQAVIDKIAYLEEEKEIAGRCSTAAEFIDAMNEAFPDYEMPSYLEMSAAMFFPTEG